MIRFLSGFLDALVHISSDYANTPTPTPALVAATGVVFSAQHDPAVIEMVNGDRYSVRYPTGAWTRVAEWAPGRALDLIYSQKDGAGLRDRITHEILPLVDCPEGKHPLDIEFAVMMANTVSTQDIVELYNAFIPKWETEVARSYKQLQMLPNLSRKNRKALMAAERSWRAFYAAQSKAIASVLYSRDGTMWRIEAASAHLRLVRNHARQLFPTLDYAPIEYGE